MAVHLVSGPGGGFRSTNDPHDMLYRTREAAEAIDRQHAPMPDLNPLRLQRRFEGGEFHPVRRIVRETTRLVDLRLGAEVEPMSSFETREEYQWTGPLSAADFFNDAMNHARLLTIDGRSRLRVMHIVWNDNNETITVRLVQAHDFDAVAEEIARDQEALAVRQVRLPLFQTQAQEISAEEIDELFSVDEPAQPEPVVLYFSSPQASSLRQAMRYGNMVEIEDKVYHVLAVGDAMIACPVTLREATRRETSADGSTVVYYWMEGQRFSPLPMGNTPPERRPDPTKPRGRLLDID